MLKSIFIQNFALIDKVTLSFSEGFSVITGETGSGKSILLGALSLILGKRADPGVMLNKNEKCIVEGVFANPSPEIVRLFLDNDLDVWPDAVIIRREISQGGKSRAFVNDTPVTLDILQQLGSMLVDIHSQHSLLSLNNPAFQLGVIDAYAGIINQSNRYRSLFLAYTKAVKELERMKETERDAQSEKDYLLFQIEEIDRLNIKENEDAELEKELRLLTHAAEIQNIYLEASHLLEDEILNRLYSILEKFRKIADLDEIPADLTKRFEQNYIDLKDILSELASPADNLQSDPARAEQITARIDAINRLLHKHHVPDVQSLLHARKEIGTKLQEIDSLEQSILIKAKECDAMKKELIAAAEEMSGARSGVFNELEEKVTAQLVDLGMQRAVFSISHRHVEEPGVFGADDISFLFNANNMGENREIAKTASGGELSRLMLSIKSLVSGKRNFPTIILDEIDMGVSGQIANRVGELLKNLSRGMQVIAITHLPQIAGKGDSHLFVYKQLEGEATVSRFSVLEKEERVEAIARMLSGETLSEASLETARTLITKQKGDTRIN